MSKSIIVIGSGFGGLSAAIRLAAQGHRVQLFEKRDKLGGRAYVYERNGFTFDGGPTVITAPWMLDELWVAGEQREDSVQLVRLDPFYRIFDHNKRYLDYNGDHDSFCNRSSASIPPTSRVIAASLPPPKKYSRPGWPD